MLRVISGFFLDRDSRVLLICLFAEAHPLSSALSSLIAPGYELHRDLRNQMACAKHSNKHPPGITILSAFGVLSAWLLFIF